MRSMAIGARIGWIKDQQADALVRCSAHTSPLFDRDEHRLNLISWLKGRHAPVASHLRGAGLFPSGRGAPASCAPGGLAADRKATASRSKTQVQESQPE